MKLSNKPMKPSKPTSQIKSAKRFSSVFDMIRQISEEMKAAWVGNKLSRTPSKISYCINSLSTFSERTCQGLQLRVTCLHNSWHYCHLPCLSASLLSRKISLRLKTFSLKWLPTRQYRLYWGFCPQCPADLTWLINLTIPTAYPIRSSGPDSSRTTADRPKYRKLRWI